MVVVEVALQKVEEVGLSLHLGHPVVETGQQQLERQPCTVGSIGHKLHNRHRQHTDHCQFHNRQHTEPRSPPQELHYPHLERRGLLNSLSLC
jgi:hypothetical protein